MTDKTLVTQLDIAIYLQAMNIERDLEKSKTIIKEIFKRITKLTMEENKVVHIQGFGKFCQHSNPAKQGGGKLKNVTIKPTPASVTLGFSRVISDKTRRIIDDRQHN